MIALIEHHKNGGEIQRRSKTDTAWIRDLRPSWAFDLYEYRIKREPMELYIYLYKGGEKYKYGYAGNAYETADAAPAGARKFVEVIE
jgi:hypothetical protein